eukprot:1169063-Pyramimonas_sp.AAC.1
MNSPPLTVNSPRHSCVCPPAGGRRVQGARGGAWKEGGGGRGVRVVLHRAAAQVPGAFHHP